MYTYISGFTAKQNLIDHQTQRGKIPFDPNWCVNINKYDEGDRQSPTSLNNEERVEEDIKKKRKDKWTTMYYILIQERT